VGLQQSTKTGAKAYFFVNYTEASSEEAGFFGRIFGGGKEQDIIKANYQILVQTVGSDTEVRVVDAEGSSLTRVKALKLLTILRSNLS
jgi:uncharacterized lipoprotein